MATATTYSTDPALYIVTSLTAGSSHIVTATSRLETILRANKIPFKAVDIATDDKARMLWGRRAGKDAGGRLRKLPGLIQEGMVLGDLVEIEEWNEYGEVKQNVKIFYDENTIPPISMAPPPEAPKSTTAKPAAVNTANTSTLAPSAGKTESAEESKPAKTTALVPDRTLPIRSIADEAAQKAKELRLQSLRDKVYGKADRDKDKEATGTEKHSDGLPEAKSEEDTTTKHTDLASSPPDPDSKGADAAAHEERLASVSSNASVESKPAGLQSPTTGTWKAGDPDKLRDGLQSPTTTRWLPSHVEPPVTSHMGSIVTTASEEEIAAIEESQTIKEGPEMEEAAEAEDAAREAERKESQAIKEEPGMEKAAESEDTAREAERKESQ